MIRLREKSTRDQVNAISTASKLALKQGELKAKRETILKMLVDGLHVDIISKYTGLFIEEVEKLKHTKR